MKAAMNPNPPVDHMTTLPIVHGWRQRPVLASHCLPSPPGTTLRPEHNGQHFADNIFNCIFLNENLWISNKFFFEICSLGSKWWWVSIGSGNGLASKVPSLYLKWCWPWCDMVPQGHYELQNNTACMKDKTSSQLATEPFWVETRDTRHDVTGGIHNSWIFSSWFQKSLAVVPECVRPEWSGRWCW